jgi:hypothetical protein
MLTRAQLLESYAPKEASEYAYGSIVPNPRQTLARRLQLLRTSPASSDISSDNFQRFLLMQQNPEALGLAQMKLPNTKFGNMSSYFDSGATE